MYFSLLTTLAGDSQKIQIMGITNIYLTYEDLK